MRKMKYREKRLALIVAITMCLFVAPVLNLSWAAEIEHISMEELKTVIESGAKGVLIVDVQPAGAYKTGHIKGAISFPWKPEIDSPGILPKDKGIIIVVYCDCSHEEDSIDTATQLQEKWDYTNIKVLKGSWTKWKTLGYPIEK